jgi:hypothetical protein
MERESSCYTILDISFVETSGDSILIAVSILIHLRPSLSLSVPLCSSLPNVRTSPQRRRL